MQLGVQQQLDRGAQRTPHPPALPPPLPAGGRATKKVEPVLGGYQQAAYATERVWSTAGDGTQVPISLVYRWGPGGGAGGGGWGGGLEWLACMAGCRRRRRLPPLAPGCTSCPCRPSACTC
jgi:hypothetical protein